MNTCLKLELNEVRTIPNSFFTAAQTLRGAFRISAPEMRSEAFLQVWHAIAYLYPGLHPDGFELAESGWPRVLKPFAEEAWRRSEAGLISEGHLYPSDAAWAGIFDRMLIHLPSETERRLQMASIFGYSKNA